MKSRPRKYSLAPLHTVHQPASRVGLESLRLLRRLESETAARVNDGCDNGGISRVRNDVTDEGFIFFQAAYRVIIEKA